jgi:hypothetical protein
VHVPPFRKLLPVSRLTVGLWLWRHRAEILGWAQFAGKAARRLASGETDDVMSEARLRMSLTAESRTRDVPSLDVDVRNGVVTLRGRVPPEVHDAAIDVATRSNKLRVRDELEDTRATR